MEFNFVFSERIDMKYLMICEKPSVMRAVKACYESHTTEIKNKVGEIDFIAVIGHICTNYEPDDYPEWENLRWNEIDYPIVPDPWKVKLINNPYSRKIIKEIHDAVDRYDGFIVGMDSDVEGYGIYYLIENYLGISKKKALRFMEHSLTDKEILESFLSMRDYHTDPQHKQATLSFILRSRADWLYGMNASRMMSNKMHLVMAVGRVKAPTTKLVYDNSTEIEKFIPKNYYVIEADYGTFKAIYSEDKKVATRFDDIPDISSIPLTGEIEDIEKQRVKTHAPKLYDLTAIQGDAGRAFGYRPDETLNIIQSLYEKHKVISYPRTQCRYISSEKSKEFKNMINQMNVFDDLKELSMTITAEDIIRVSGDKQIVNDKEVEKESHDALLPTNITPDLSKMTESEINICHMIYKRLLAQFLPMLEEDKTKLIIKHGDHTFVARGKTIIDQGWRKLYLAAKEAIIPDIKKGDLIQANGFASPKKVTTPPKRLTTYTLIEALANIDTIIKDKALKKTMAESKGLGTPATRADIIKDIIERGYVADKKDGLYITDKGKKYIEAIINLDIVSPIFAAKMDTKIKQIQRGEQEYDLVYQEIIDNLNAMCNQIDEMPEIVQTVDVTCIKCKGNLIDQPYSYECPRCNIKIPKKILNVTITETELNSIMHKKRTKLYHFIRKEKDPFYARIYWNENTEKLAFDSSIGISCPVCTKDTLRINRGGIFCNSCELKLFRKYRNHEFTDKELLSLVTGQSLKHVKFRKKDDSEYEANVLLKKDGNLEVFWDKS